MTSKQILPKGVLALYKRLGETPLQCLDRLRTERPEFTHETLSYAGRLDPLASGIMLVLVGQEANQNRESYLGLPKVYEVEVFFGVSTDTFDVLGLVTDSIAYDTSTIQSIIEENLKNLSNFHDLDYPPYSSKTINGKPLFQWAREGKLGEIELPKQKGKILNIEFLEGEIKQKADIEKEVFNMIDKVSGDFRQTEIKDSWANCFANNLNSQFFVAKFRIECESGTYMRSFANRLGELVKIPALAFSIMRTKIGDYSIDEVLE